MLMLHFIARARMTAATDDAARAPSTVVAAWWGTALAAIALPWLLYPTVGGSLAKAAELGSLIDLAWPMLLGAAAYALATRLQPWPVLPPGDVLVVLPRARAIASRLLDGIAAIEGRLTLWPVAGATLVLLAIGFAAAMLAAR
jgi:hypothetical protein